MQCPVDTLTYRHTSREIKHDCLFPDANFPVWAQRQQFIKWGMSCRAVIRLLWTRSSSQTKDVKPGGWRGASPFNHGILRERHEGNECCCQSLLAVDGLFFKGSACLSPTMEEGRMAGQSTCTWLFGIHHNTFRGFTKWKTSFKKICRKIMSLDLHYERICIWNGHIFRIYLSGWHKLKKTSL